MKTINFITIFTVALFLISNVSADIFSIGGTGGDEILFGYGDQIELFFTGSEIVSQFVTITSPADGYRIYDFVSGSVSVEVNFSISGIIADSCWYNIGSTNVSIPCSSGNNNFTLYLSSAGNFTLSVYLNDSLGNEKYDSINIIVSPYTGPQQGGGATAEPDQEEDDEGIGGYNSTIMCFNIDNFFSDHINFTDEDIEILKNDLAVKFGFAVTDDIIDRYLLEFESLCPDYITPTEEPVEPDKKTDYKNLFIFIIFIIIIILILIIAYDHDRFILILNKSREGEDKERKLKSKML